MRKNESDLIRKKLKEAILKMTPYDWAEHQAGADSY